MKRILLFFVVWLISLTSFSQVNFETTRVAPAIYEPYDVFYADLNNDNKPDIVTVSYKDNLVVWYENLGNGEFSAHKVISDDVEKPQGVFAADLDGDGNIDVISASRDDDKVAWYKNNGNGNFSEQKVITTSANAARNLYVADINEDSYPDVVCANMWGGIDWYENNGNGTTWTTHTVIASGDIAIPSSVFAADINGDNHIDILSTSENDDKVAWYPNDGTGNFSTQNVIDLIDRPYSVYATDIDGDSDIDVMAAASTDKKVMLYINDGTGAFTDTITVDDDAYGACWVRAADLDDDGQIDIMAAVMYDSQVVWYKNTGGNTFSTKKIITEETTQPIRVFATDLDQDNNIDILSASIYENKIFWVKNEGNGNFSQEAEISITDLSSVQIFGADLNNDNYGDIVYTSKFGNRIFWIPNDGNNNFIKNELVADLNNAYALSVSDMDNDGDVDIIAGSFDFSATNADKIIWAENDGNGNFTAFDISTSLNKVKAINVADINNDGNKDIIYSTYGNPNEFAWLEGSENGTYSTKHVIDNNFTTGNIFPVDIDYDNDIDILTTNTTGNQILLYENNGSSEFSKVVIADTNYSPQSVFVTDIDGDNDLDILAACYNDNKIICYKNDGATNFNESFIIDNNLNNAKKVVAADLDQDGDIDVAATNYIASDYDSNVLWYENQGNDNFSAGNILATKTYYNDVFTVDMDNDGDEDIVSCANFQIDFHENHSSAIIEQPQSATVCPNTTFVSFSLTADMATAYQWYVSTDGGAVFSAISDGAVYTGATTNTLFINYSSTMSEYKYYCSVSNSFGIQNSDTVGFISDAIPPVLTVQNTTVYLDETGNATITKDNVIASVSDNCSVVDTTLSQTSFDCSNIGENTIKVVITDAAGNQDSADVTVTVADTIFPTFTCVADTTIEISGSDVYVVNGNEFDPQNVADNCSVDTISNDFNNLATLDGAELNAGSHTITWTVTDAGGNQAQCSFTVTVQIGDAVNELANSTKLFPNPTTGKFSIQLDKTQKSTISITDFSGKIIMQLSDNQEVVELDLTDYPSGIYFVKIQTDDDVEILKVVKE